MRMARRASVTMAIGLALAAATALHAHVRPGQKAPSFTITTFDKTRIRSEDLRGQVVIVNYWATWCGPCKMELPGLDAYYRAHAGQGLRVFGVTTEGSVSERQLAPLAAALAFPLAHNLSGTGLGEMGGLPTNYVIDRAGVVRYAEVGAFDAETLDEVVDPLLAEPAP
jgi:cytochrome c biogenesis protein CcmG/thiol:disulfide interchange protein DsbE